MDSRYIIPFILILILIVPVIAVHPADTYIKAAETFREQKGGEESSAAMFEKASELSGGRYDLLREGARMYANAHQYQKAMDTMNRSIILGGDHVASYVFMGIWAVEGFNNTAMRDEYLRKAVTCEIKDEVDAYNKAMAQAFLGDLNGGKETIINATERFNTTDYLWDWRGLFEAAGGDYQAALRSYDQAINLTSEPSSKASCLSKKATYAAMGGLADPEEMINMSKKAVELNADYEPDFISVIGAAYARKGDYKNASPYFEPEKSPFYQYYDSDNLLRADYLYKTGKKEEAVKIFEKTRIESEKLMNDRVWRYLNARLNLDTAESGLFTDAMDRKDAESALRYAGSLSERNPGNSVYLQKLSDAQNLTADKKP